MKDKLFFTVLLILFILGIGIFIKPQNKVSFLERRDLYDVSDINIFDLSNSCDKVLSDQFYFRDNITKLYRTMNTSLSLTFGSNKIDDIEINQLNDDFMLLSEGYLSRNAIDYNEKNIMMASNHGFNINEFDLTYPNIRTYVYKCTGIEEMLNTDYPFQDKCWDAMIFQFNPNIRYGKLEIKDYSTYKKYHYKSDMHWNASGAYQGYKDIIGMISKDFDIGEPKNILQSLEFPFVFKGGYSDKIVQFDGYDHLTDYELDGIGDYAYYSNGKLFDLEENKKIYSAQGNTSAMNDYEFYFGYLSYEKLYDFKNDTKPNLLILSNSFGMANNTWIASHFNKTIIVDVRLKPNLFNIKQYIDKYNIELVLIEYNSKELFFDDYTYISID